MDVVDPGLAAALERFERILAERFPNHLALLEPGADDADLDRLRSAVAPYLIPAQVEQLYRWRAGGFVRVFGGFFLRPLDDLIEYHRFLVGDLDKPSTWLSLLDRHSHTFVALGVPGQPPDRRVWSGDTHDEGAALLFDSLQGLVETLCEVADAGVLASEDEGFFRTTLGLSWEDEIHSIDEPAFREYRRIRVPSTWPAGESAFPPVVSWFGPLPSWPASWLHPYGLSDGDVRPRGATHTIAEAVAAAASGPLAVSLAVRVGAPPHRSDLGLREVEDDTGTLALVTEQDARGLVLPRAGEVEVDVLVTPGHLPPPVQPPQEGAPAHVLEHHARTVARLTGHTVGTLVAIRAGEGEHHESLGS